MNNKQFHHSEKMLRDVLKRAQMHPSQRFYDQMAHAPWVAPASPITVRRSRHLFPLTAAVATLVLIVLFLLAVPFRSLAQQAFDFFTRGERDTIASPAFIEPTAVTPVLGDLADIRRVSDVAGFTVRLPTTLPEDLQIIDTNINLGNVTVTYSGEQTHLIFLQQVDAAASLYIGANAEVEPVSVDGVTGEYVRGGWRQTERGIVWDNSLGSSYLIWEKNGIRYTLTVEAGSMSRETLIQIADSLP